MRHIWPVLCCMVLIACEQQAPEAAPRAAQPASSPPALARQPAPANADVYIISPAGGATVGSPVRVTFGLTGFGVAPAGVNQPNTGHHHLLIDTEVTNFDVPIPADDQHVHFGFGQTEAEIVLAPGQHRLQLLLGDHLHIPHDPPLMSEPITIEVTQ